jgi:hypothetical protein
MKEILVPLRDDEVLPLDGTRSDKQTMYYVLMRVAVPCILFIFILLFGSDSYQMWDDRFDYWLTNKYLFSRAVSDSVVGPLWRDDILSGHVWAGSLHTTPLAIDVLLGRYLALAPIGIDFVGSFALYIISIVGMYLYVRQVVRISLESATLAAVMFGVTTYWMAFWHGSADFPMASAWLPLLLYMTHVIESSTRLHWADHLARIVVFSFLCFAFAVNTSIATLPFVLITLFLYIFVSFGLSKASMWNVAAASLGVLLYSPFLWQFFQMATLSPRYKINETGPQHLIDSSSGAIVTYLSEALREIMTNHNVVGLSLPAKLGLIMLIVMKLTWHQEPPNIRRMLTFAGGIVGIGLFAQSGVIDYSKLKMAIPVLGGFGIGRFSYLTPVGLMILLGWVYDRCMSGHAPLAPEKHRHLLGLAAYVSVATLTLAHIAYVTGKLNLIPSSVAPQNYVLWGLFFVYAVCTLMLLGCFYRRVFQSDKTCSAHLLFLLMIVTVSLDASVHAYRTNISEQGNGSAARPIMSYAERYRVSKELLRVKTIGESYGRAITLEPFSRVGWSYQELAPLALAQISTIGGYNPLLPLRYQRLVNVAINGRDRAPFLTELIVDDNPAFKPELLSLLNVGIVLTRQERTIPGYDVAARFNSNGTILHLIQDRKYLGHAFVARSSRCFRSDEEALQYIRNVPREDLKSYAPLVGTDPDAAEICKKRTEFGAVDVHSESTNTVVAADRVTVEVDSGGGILNLADNYYPGWMVSVDGQQKPLLRTYTSLRGVEISAGHHSVEYVFRPAGYYILLKLSCIVGVVLLGVLCLSLIKKACISSARWMYS